MAFIWTVSGIPEKPGHGPSEQGEFGKNPSQYPAEWRAYRTDLVNRMVRETWDSVTAVKPHVVYSAAVWGIYYDKWKWKTLAGQTDLMQDSRAWAKNGYMDVLVPMTYSRIKEPCARIDWGCMLDEQMQGGEKETGRQMYIGIDASKGAREVVNQVRMARSRERPDGDFLLFCSRGYEAFQLLASTVFRTCINPQPGKISITLMPSGSASSSIRQRDEDAGENDSGAQIAFAGGAEASVRLTCAKGDEARLRAKPLLRVRYNRCRWRDGTASNVANAIVIR